MKTNRLALVFGPTVALIVCVLTCGQESPRAVAPSSTAQQIVRGARAEIENGTRYDWAYIRSYYPPVYDTLGKKHDTALYPWGDVDPDRGVCADLIVRSLREAGIDLQKAIHEDITENPGAYELNDPWRMINHRRVRVQKQYFERHWLTLPNDPTIDSIWQPGDIIVWDVGKKQIMHAGIISDKRTPEGRPYVIHLQRPGTELWLGRAAEQDILLGARMYPEIMRKWKIVGHYRYKPDAD